MYYNVGSAPSAAQIAGNPNFTTQSSNGATINGLQANTTYFFAVVAKYPDGTSSLQNGAVQATTMNATFTTAGLINLPTVTASTQWTQGQYFKVTVSGGAASYQTTVFTGNLSNPSSCPTILPSLIHGQGVGSGAFTSTNPLSVGVYNFNVQVLDTLSGLCAYASFNSVTVTAQASSSLAVVSASTPTALNPIPTIAVNPVIIGRFPQFQISGGQSNYKTELYYGTTLIGSLIGNGTLTTLSTTPLPRGEIQITPVITSGNEVAQLAPLTLRVKATDPEPYVPPLKVDQIAANGIGLGTSMARGDFNCDGFTDVAIGGPAAAAGPIPNYNSSQQANGAVAIYYGTASGIDFSATPSVTPLTPSTQPLLILAPSTTNNTSNYGQLFGASLAAGNLNKDLFAGKSCDDLVVGAPGDYNEAGSARDAGAIYVFYGSPMGLQVSNTYTFNSITCASVGSSACGSAKYAPFKIAGEGWYTGSSLGFGTSVAIGDFDGDGYDEVAVGWPRVSSVTAYAAGAGRSNEGQVYLYRGSPNGLTPNYVQFEMPAGTTATSTTLFGNTVAFGYISDSTHTKKDLVVGAYNLNQTPAGGRGGVFWIKGQNLSDTSAWLNANNQLIGGAANYVLIQPDRCRADIAGNWGTGALCGYFVETADVNADGLDDILFSAPSATVGWSANGAFFVYYGNTSSGPYNTLTPVTINTSSTCFNPSPTQNGVLSPYRQTVNPCNPQAFYRTDGFYNWRLGSAIQNLGDTDGDGFPEIGIGANGANALRNGQYTNNGLAYVFHGGLTGLNVSPINTFNLNSPRYALFGSSMVGGNFRSKTCSVSTGTPTSACNDILVGAPGQSPTGTSMSEGLVHAFYNPGTSFATSIGSSNAITDVVPAAITQTDFYRARIVGDLNGDGFADVAAAFKYQGPHTSIGGGMSAYPSLRFGIIVYYGTENGINTSVMPMSQPLAATDPLLIWDYDPAISQFYDSAMATSFDRAGDVNHDGFDDLILSGNQNSNRITLFYGSAAGLITQPRPLANPASPLEPVLISSGSNLFIGSNGDTFNGTSQNIAAGDYNGDDYSDIAFLVARRTVSWNTPDFISVVYGSETGLVAGGALKHPEMGTYPDAVNPDNNANWLPNCVGTRCNPLAICPSNELFCANATINASFSSRPASGSYSNRMAGPSRIINAGDTDGDGTDDLAMTDFLDNSFYNVTGGFSGAVYIFYGSYPMGIRGDQYAKLRISPQFVPLPQGSYRQLGNENAVTGTLSRAGRARHQPERVKDINGDGYSDIVVGAPYETTGPQAGTYYSSGGAAYVIYGMNGGYKLGDPVSCPSYPCTVTINNAPGNVASYSPSEVVDNIPSCDTSSNRCSVLRFHPAGVAYGGFNFGWGTLGLGDLDGDGYHDVGVSAPNTTNSAGPIYIFKGSSTGLQVGQVARTNTSCSNGVCAPQLFVAPAPAAYVNRVGLAFSVNGHEGIGDVDGDGREDFIISSPYFNNPDGSGFFNGGFYLFH